MRDKLNIIVQTLTNKNKLKSLKLKNSREFEASLIMPTEYLLKHIRLSVSATKNSARLCQNYNYKN